MVVIAAAVTDLDATADMFAQYAGDLDGDGEWDEVPVLDDADAGLYYASYSGGSVGVWLVAPGGELVASGYYASEIAAEDIEAVLP
jgi:hypothetical protein